MECPTVLWQTWEEVASALKCYFPLSVPLPYCRQLLSQEMLLKMRTDLPINCILLHWLGHMLFLLQDGSVVQLTRLFPEQVSISSSSISPPPWEGSSPLPSQEHLESLGPHQILVRIWHWLATCALMSLFSQSFLSAARQEKGCKWVLCGVAFMDMVSVFTWCWTRLLQNQNSKSCDLNTGLASYATLTGNRANFSEKLGNVLKICSANFGSLCLRSS